MALSGPNHVHEAHARVASPPECNQPQQQLMLNGDCRVEVGTEYEVANGEVVRNFGEKRCLMRIKERSQDELDIVLQVVEDVHKPLLAVSSIVRQGHKLTFAKQKFHIRLSSGGQIPMGFQNGTYELEIFVKRPGFSRQSGR